MYSADAQIAANRFRFLAEATAWRYRSQGFFVRWLVREILLRDPAYRELISPNRLPTEGLLLHLGCGRGVLLALLVCARAMGMAGSGNPGVKPRLMGIELGPAAVESAKLALDGEAEIIAGDLRSVQLPPCRVAILLDVLVFLEPDEQDRLLERIVSVLEVGGCLILRDPSASNFVDRAAIRLAGRVYTLFCREQKIRLYPRSEGEWKKQLESLELQVETIPMNPAGMFRKVQLLARKI